MKKKKKKYKQISTLHSVYIKKKLKVNHITLYKIEREKFSVETRRNAIKVSRKVNKLFDSTNVANGSR